MNTEQTTDHAAKLILLIIVLIGSLGLQTRLVNAESGNLVGTSTEVTAVDESFEQKSFFAEGRYWVFYVPNAADPKMAYRTSIDGETWADPINIAAAMNGYDFSVSIDGQDMSYARADHWSDNLYYRRGEVNSSGLITWYAAEQLVHDGSANDHFEFPKILDNGGEAFIGARKTVAAATYRPYILKNANSDGTWADEAGFPIELESMNTVYWRVSPVGLTASKVYVYYVCTEIGGHYPSGRVWDGATMGSEENVTTTYYEDFGHQHGIIAVGDDVHLIYRVYVGHGDFLAYFKRTYGVGWSSAETISVSETKAPTLTVDTSTNKLYVIYRQGTAFMTFNKTIGSAWGSARVFLDESSDGLPSDSTGKSYTAWYNDGNGYAEVDGTIGFLYMTKSASPFNVKFALIDTSPSVFVTFYKNDGIFSVNGSAKANGTTLEYDGGTVLSLQGSGWTKYYGFGNFTFSYGSHSDSNPTSHVVTVAYGNYSIWLYNEWSPWSYPPDFPSSPLALQYLINGNYLGFIHSIFYSLMGQTFYAFIMLILYIAIYLRLKTIAMPSVAWLLMGSFWAAVAPAFTPVPYILSAIGVAGIVYSMYSKGSEN